MSENRRVFFDSYCSRPILSLTDRRNGDRDSEHLKWRHDTNTIKTVWQPPEEIPSFYWLRVTYKEALLSLTTPAIVARFV